MWWRSARHGGESASRAKEIHLCNVTASSLDENTTANQRDVHHAMRVDAFQPQLGGLHRPGVPAAQPLNAGEALHMLHQIGENAAKLAHTSFRRWCCGVTFPFPLLLSVGPNFPAKLHNDGIQFLFSGLADFSTSEQTTASDDVVWWVQRYLLDVFGPLVGGENRHRSDWDEESGEVFETTVRASNDAIWGVWSGSLPGERDIYAFPQDPEN